MTDLLFYCIPWMQLRKRFVESPCIPLIIYIWQSEPRIFSPQVVIYIYCHHNFVYSWTAALPIKPAISQYGYENVKTVMCSSSMFSLFWIDWMWCIEVCEPYCWRL